VTGCFAGLYSGCGSCFPSANQRMGGGDCEVGLDGMRGVVSSVVDILVGAVVPVVPVVKSD
jgi:hypothetical protein